MDPLELCYMSAGQLSRRVQAKEVSPVEIVEAHLTRIGATEPVLNSFITLLPEEAQAAARRAETEIQAGNYRGPLHGIPVGLKDLFNTAAVRTTSGSRIFDNFVPQEDCTVAARFRQAGAILLGKLNMHPFAYGPTGENSDYGHMHNPWDPELVAGGSSGGSGSATAAGQCTITTGSDTGGSIRIPAALCGIVGFKPTYGLVSRYGLTPLSWSLDHPGPMVRTVEDAALTMNVIAGHDPRDVASAQVDVPDFTTALSGDVRGLRIGVPREYFEAPLDPEVGQAVRDASTCWRTWAQWSLRSLSPCFFSQILSQLRSSWRRPQPTTETCCPRTPTRCTRRCAYAWKPACLSLRQIICGLSKPGPCLTVRSAGCWSRWTCWQGPPSR